MWLAFGSSCIIQRNLWTSKVKWSGRKICRRCCKKNYYPLVAVFNGGGGVFGVGTSELVVIGIVAWVVLGPKRLYALSKDVGRIFGELRKSAEEAKTTLLTALESELEESTTKEKEEAQPSMETKVQEGAQWSDLLTQQKQNTTAVTQGNDAFDKDRKVFLRQMEQLESSNPQPPSYVIAFL